MSLSNSEVDVLYVIAHGLSARMILHSEVVEALQARGLSVGLIAPTGSSQSLRADTEPRGVRVFEMSTPRLARLFDAEQLRRYLFEDVRGNPALFAKFQREVLSRKNPLPRLKALGLYGLNRVLQRHVALRDIAFGAQ